MKCSYQLTTISDFGSINGSPPMSCGCEGSFAIYGNCPKEMCKAIYRAMKRDAENKAAKEAALTANTKAGRLARKNAAIAASQKKKAKADKKK